MRRLKNLIRNINYLMKHSLYDQREEDIVFLSQKILDDGIYHYGIDVSGYKKLKILNKMESIERISNSNKSFVRFGDGEIRLMLGENQAFQKYDDELVAELYKLLKHDNPNVMVAINRGYFQEFEEDELNYYIRYGYEYRRFFAKHCDFEKEYLDAACTFGRWGEKNDNMDCFWEKWRSLFASKDIVIVCGEHILDKLEYDVFELANSKEYIYGPRIDSWDKREDIVDKIQMVDKNKLLVFILGMGGKAIIPTVADMGYTAWDVGHLAKSYNIYMKGCSPTKEEIRKFYEPD